MNPLDMPIDDFTASLPMRPRNCIKANFFSPFETDEHIKPPHTVRHLMMFSRKEIRMWTNLGKKSLNEIEEQLRSLGLQLWDEHDDRSLYPLINYVSESVLQQRIAGLKSALRAALEQPEQEPVAYCYVKKGSSADALTFDPNPANAVSDTVFPLYAAPPQRKPLTDDEIIEMAKQSKSAEPGLDGYILPISFARAIEQAHGIGETP